MAMSAPAPARARAMAVPRSPVPPATSATRSLRSMTGGEYHVGWPVSRVQGPHRALTFRDGWRTLCEEVISLLACIGAVRKAVHVRRPQRAKLQPLLVRPRLLRTRAPRGVHDVRVDDLGSEPQSTLPRLSGSRAGRAPRALPALRRRARRSHQSPPAPRGDADPRVPRARHGLRAHPARPGAARDPPRPRRPEQRLPRIRRAEPHGVGAAAR